VKNEWFSLKSAELHLTKIRREG